MHSNITLLETKITKLEEKRLRKRNSQFLRWLEAGGLSMEFKTYHCVILWVVFHQLYLHGFYINFFVLVPCFVHLYIMKFKCSDEEEVFMETTHRTIHLEKDLDCACSQIQCIFLNICSITTHENVYICKYKPECLHMQMYINVCKHHVTWWLRFCRQSEETWVNGIALHDVVWVWSIHVHVHLVCFHSFEWWMCLCVWQLYSSCWTTLQIDLGRTKDRTIASSASGKCTTNLVYHKHNLQGLWLIYMYIVYAFSML